MTEMNTENKLEAMQRANGPLLEVKNLQVDFTTDDGQPVHAVRNSSFSVYPGQWVAIVGESGSGKSTLAYTLAGHPKYEVDSGEALLDGVDILKQTPDLRAKEGLFLAMQYPVRGSWRVDDQLPAHRQDRGRRQGPRPSAPGPRSSAPR